MPHMICVKLSGKSNGVKPMKAAGRPNSSPIQFVTISFAGKFEYGIENFLFSSISIRFQLDSFHLVNPFLCWTGWTFSGLKGEKKIPISVRNWIQYQLPLFQLCPIVSRITWFKFPCTGDLTNWIDELSGLAAALSSVLYLRHRSLLNQCTQEYSSSYIEWVFKY